MNIRNRNRILYALVASLASFYFSSLGITSGASIGVISTPVAAKGEVTSVTLYSLQARVERTLGIAAGEAGLREVVLGPLPASIIDSSIQVEGTEGLVSVSVQVQRSSGDPVESAGVKEKRAKLQELEQSLLRLQREDQSLEELRSRFARILPKRPEDKDTSVIIDLDAWQGLLDMVKQGMQGAATSRVGLAPGLREAQEKVQQARRSLENLLQQRDRARAEVVVGLQDRTGDGGVIRVSYLIPQASWYPHYEVDVDIASGTLQLRAFAIVRQLTGEDWPEVSVSFSTSTPELGSGIPELAAIRLERSRYEELNRRARAEDRRYLPEASRGLYKQVGGRLDSYNGIFDSDDDGVEVLRDRGTLRQRPSSIRHAESVVAGLPALEKAGNLQIDKLGRMVMPVLPIESNRGFLRTFTSVKPEQIPSDGEPHRLLYAIKNLEFEEERICVGEANTAVFRRITALLHGSDPLLEGSVAVFLGEDYLGRSTIKTTAPAEELTLDLGVDGQVTVDRIQRESEEKIGIFSKAIHYRTDLEMTIENFHSEPVSILLRERIPFTESKQLKVRVDRSATTHLPEGLESDDGLLSWQLTVLPGEPINLRFVWWIEAPPDVRLTRREAPERLGEGE